ncbi:MAG TPA: nucleotidyltransferase domain-containing protein [Methylomirabilota bacterium]|nr:nucleotidyltransferase domain-containing protein [Methylomirabilota bacterium]
MPSHRQAANTSPTAIKALEEVRRIVRETVGSENADVHLFGSWARGEATRPSDIDIAIDPRETLPRGTLARLRERLEESHVPYRVDVVDLRRTDSEFRRRVLTEGIPWND